MIHEDHEGMVVSHSPESIPQWAWAPVMILTGSLRHPVKHEARLSKKQLQADQSTQAVHFARRCSKLPALRGPNRIRVAAIF